MRRSTAAEPTLDRREAPPGLPGDAAAGSVSWTRRGAALVGVTVLVGAWFGVAAGLPPVVLPTPAETGSALVELAVGGELTEQLGRTLWRTAVGSAIGIGLGLVLGVAAGVSAAVDGLLQPLRIFLVGLPPVVTVVLAMIWLGPGGAVVVLAVVAAMFPHVLIASREATRVVDRDLLEMSRSFRVPAFWRLRHVVLPAVAPPVLAAIAVTLSNALRLAMMAELLAAPDGSGAGLATARTYLDTPTVFAWAAVAVTFALVVDWFVLGPVRRRAVAWSG